MIESDFIYNGDIDVIQEGVAGWQAPSNIAIVKYWGKYGLQLPKNASLSFTLSKAFTKTSITYRPKSAQHQTLGIFLNKEPKPEFLPKIQKFLNNIEPYCPYIADLDFDINTHNSFPHSSGIASSASGFAALALCIMSIEKTLNPEMTDVFFYQKSTFLARLGSGSATRSVKGSHVLWGEHADLDESSNLFGIDKSRLVHDVFKDYQDTILLIDKGQKKVSSTVGHGLMNDHLFAEQRFKQAQDNILKLMSVLKSGDIESFINIMETEALSLHAMMMTANPYFILMQPNTLQVIYKIWAFRQETKQPVGFTLDAGANVHILYPKSNEKIIKAFILSDLVSLGENNQYICDHVGGGAVKIN